MVLLLALLAQLTLNKNGAINQAYQLLMILTLFISLPVYSSCQVYERRTGYLSGSWRVCLAWVITLIIMGWIGFITKSSATYSREVILQWAALGLIVQVAGFCSLHRLARLWSVRAGRKTKTAIVGTGPLAYKLAEIIRNNPSENLVGLIALQDSPDVGPGHSPQVLGTVYQLHELLGNHAVSRLYIALALAEADQIETMYIDLLDLNVDVIWLPDLGGMMLLNHSVSSIAGMPAIHLNESPMTTHRLAASMKTVLDRILALAAIIVLSPVFVATAIAIKLDSPGPILFKQKRHGWNGKIIDVWKFRSMYVHDDAQVKQATQNDSRVTKVGQFIRRSSMDELPQFFNVLLGDMSLVGPRPHALAHNTYYMDKVSAYMARHRIKPGITGLAQINGCRGETQTVEQMKARVEYDLGYINSWSLGLDIKILLKTPLSLFSKNIY